MFNHAEQFVLQNWADAQQVEESIATAREKYQVLCERVVDDFRAKNPQFDQFDVAVAKTSKVGRIWLGRSDWPKKGRLHAGLYVENIRLEYAARVDAEPPETYVYLPPVGGDGAGQRAKVVIREEAHKVLPADRMAAEFDWATGDEESAIGLPFCSPAELFTLLADPAGDAFVERLKGELELLALLEPAMSRTFGGSHG